jgi:hypothetical protein
LRDRSENRLGGVEDVLVAASQKRERTLFGSKCAPGNWNIEYADSTGGA